MRSLRNGIGSLLAAAMLAAPGTTQAQSPLLEEAVGLSGLRHVHGVRSCRHGPRRGPGRGRDRGRLWRDRRGQRAGAGRQVAAAPRLEFEGVRRRAARRSGGRRAAEPDRPAAALRAGGRQRSPLRRPDDHAARPRDPCRGPAARAAAGSAAQLAAVRLADRRRPFRLAGRLHPALVARQRRRLLQRRLRSAERRAGDRHGASPIRICCASGSPARSACRTPCSSPASSSARA